MNMTKFSVLLDIISSVRIEVEAPDEASAEEKALDTFEANYPKCLEQSRVYEVSVADGFTEQQEVSA